MAEFQPVEDGGEVVVHGSIGSIPFFNVFGQVLTGTFIQATAESRAAELVAAYEELDGAFVDDFHITEMVFTDLRTETGAQFVVSGDPDLVTGTSEAQPLPFQVAALVSWKTGVRGRSYRGRTYLGGFPEDLSNGRALDASLLTALGLFADAIVATEWVGVISRYSGVDEETGQPIKRDPAIITPVTSYVLHPNWRTQRRRALAND